MITKLLQTFLLSVLLTSALALAAEKLPYELQDVGINEQLGAQVDLNTAFRDETGKTVTLRSVMDGRKPALLFLAYYRCPNLCNMFLNGATEALKKMEWTPGKEFQILTVSIDPKETPPMAERKKAVYMSSYARPQGALGWHFWVNDQTLSEIPIEAEKDTTNVRKLANQVGFRYKFDKDQNQFAHTAAMMVLTPEGKVSRYLYGIEFQPKDLRLALVEAGGRKIGTVMDHILLFCYHYDPKGKRYSLYATNVMRAGGGITVFIVGGILFSFWRRNRRKRPLYVS